MEHDCLRLNRPSRGCRRSRSHQEGLKDVTVPVISLLSTLVLSFADRAKLREPLRDWVSGCDTSSELRGDLLCGCFKLAVFNQDMNINRTSRKLFKVMRVGLCIVT